MFKTLCTVCRGSKNIKCTTCDGAGFIDDVDGPTDRVCVTCQGDGSIKCKTCKGKGEITHV